MENEEWQKVMNTTNDDEYITERIISIKLTLADGEQITFNSVHYHSEDLKQDGTVKIQIGSTVLNGRARAICIGRMTIKEIDIERVVRNICSPEDSKLQRVHYDCSLGLESIYTESTHRGDKSDDCILTLVGNIDE